MVVLVLIFSLLAGGAAWRDAPTYDEPLHLATGYAYAVTGEYWLDPFHPPLIWLILALPLIMLRPAVETDHPSWRQRIPSAFADVFLYHNQRPHEILLQAERWMNILLGVFWIFLMYYWAKQNVSPFAAKISAGALVFDPNVLAHTHLVTNDVGFSLLFLFTLFAAQRAAAKPGLRRTVVMGLVLGLALASKFSAVILIFLIYPLLFYYWRRQRWRFEWIVTQTSLSMIIAVSVVLSLYHWQQGEIFCQGVEMVFRSVSERGKPSFLFGHYSAHGWPWYFVAAFLIKTPIPLLLLLGGALIGACKKHEEEFLVAWVYFPAIAYFVAASLSKLQIGIRHLLPIYPLLAIAIGHYAQRVWETRTPWARRILLAAGVWLVSETVWSYPYYLCYFNEIVGGSSQGYRYLGDSNCDWGQELKALAHQLRQQQIGAIYLSYFGTADPAIYGIHYQPLFPGNNVGRPDPPPVDLKEQRPLYLAISATNLQGMFYRPKAIFSWLRQRHPIQVIGHSLFIYDITHDASAHYEIGRMLQGAGKKVLASREFAWADSLQQRSR